jgi:hypothetical protein
MIFKKEDFILDLVNMKHTISGHPLRKLHFEDDEKMDVIIGEVSNSGSPNNFEKVRWTLAPNTLAYYCSNLGEGFDIELESKGIIYDDTSRGDDFLIRKILYKDLDSMLCEVVNPWYNDCLKVKINLNTKEVSHEELNFYLLEKNKNYEHSF